MTGQPVKHTGFTGDTVGGRRVDCRGRLQVEAFAMLQKALDTAWRHSNLIINAFRIADKLGNALRKLQSHLVPRSIVVRE